MTDSQSDNSELSRLRAELDRLDDSMHDLLRERASVVSRMAGLRLKGGVPLRPGREASIIRRLLARHDGDLPSQALARVWREIFAATTAMQGKFLIAVCDTGPASAYTQLAREHFGALTPLHIHRSPAQAIGEVSAGVASVAVLPLPSEQETGRDAWWTALLQKDEPRIYVIGLLPFWQTRPEGAPAVTALMVAAIAPDPSGVDRSLLGLEIGLDVSRARLGAALAAAGLPQDGLILRRDPGADAAYALADVDGFVTDADPRLAAIGSLLRKPVVLGAYAVQEGE